MRFTIERHPLGHCFQIYPWGRMAPLMSPDRSLHGPTPSWQFSSAIAAKSALLERFPAAEIIKVVDHLAISPTESPAAQSATHRD